MMGGLCIHYPEMKGDRIIWDYTLRLDWWG